MAPTATPPPQQRPSDSPIAGDAELPFAKAEVEEATAEAGKRVDAPTSGLTDQTFHKNGLTDQTSYLPLKKVLVVFLAMQMSVALSFLDQSIVATALPNISASFNAGRSSSWVASAYLLTSTAVLPVWGRLSDVFGRKYTMLVCVVIFWFGSLACALAQSMEQLIILRGLQGVGGGGLLTLVLIITSDLLPLQERARLQGVTEATIAISNGIGPILGGVLSQKASWRWCFWINLPIAAVALAVIAFFLPLKAVHGDIKSKLRQVDYGGALLTFASTTLLLLPLNWGGVSFAWSSPTVIGCLCGGVAGFIVFFLYESKVAAIPIVPPFIFRVQTASAVFFCTFLSGATVLQQVYMVPQFLQIVQGHSAIRSGVLILPLLLTTTVFVAISGQIVGKTGEYLPCVVGGYMLWCVGIGLLSTLNETTSTARLVGYLILTGAGQGNTLQTTMVAVQASVERSEMSVVTSTRNFLRSLGGTVSLAFSAAIMRVPSFVDLTCLVYTNNTLNKNLIPLGFSSSFVSSLIDDPTAIWRTTGAGSSALLNLPADRKALILSAYVKGFRTLFLVFVGLIGTNALVALFLIKRISLKRDDDEAMKEKGRAWIEAKKVKRKAAAAGKDGEAEKGEVSAVGQESTAVEVEHVAK